MRAILASGKNVVTPLGWFYPGRAPDVAELEAACRAGGVTLHGTGIHPGGITERFPLMVSALSRSVRTCAPRSSPTSAPTAPRRGPRRHALREAARGRGEEPDARLLGAGFEQSIDMVAAALGFALDEENELAHEMAVATAPIDTPVGPIAPGSVAAQRFTWQGTVRGEPVVTVRVNWLMGAGAPRSGVDLRARGERFEIEVAGDPPVQVTFHGLHPESIADEPRCATPVSSPPPCTA